MKLQSFATLLVLAYLCLAVSTVFPAFILPGIAIGVYAIMQEHYDGL